MFPSHASLPLSVAIEDVGWEALIPDTQRPTSEVPC